MPRIKHIAILTPDAEALAGFYKETFQLEEVQRLESDTGRWRIFLSDGHINLAILPARADGPEGINHFGFEVEDVKAISEAAVNAGAQQGPEQVARDGRGNEAFIKDPFGNRVDLSVHGWPTAPVE